MDDKQRPDGKSRNYQDDAALAGEPVTDDHEARSLEPINPDENTADEVLYGGDESD